MIIMIRFRLYVKLTNFKAFVGPQKSTVKTDLHKYRCLPSSNGYLRRKCGLTACLYAISKDQFVRVGPFPMISGVIVKSREKFPLESRFKTTTLIFFSLPFDAAAAAADDDDDEKEEEEKKEEEEDKVYGISNIMIFLSQFLQ